MREWDARHTEKAGLDQISPEPRESKACERAQSKPAEPLYQPTADLRHTREPSLNRRTKELVRRFISNDRCLLFHVLLWGEVR